MCTIRSYSTGVFVPNLRGSTTTGIVLLQHKKIRFKKEQNSPTLQIATGHIQNSLGFLTHCRNHNNLLFLRPYLSVTKILLTRYRIGLHEGSKRLHPIELQSSPYRTNITYKNWQSGSMVELEFMLDSTYIHDCFQASQTPSPEPY